MDSAPAVAPGAPPMPFAQVPEPLRTALTERGFAALTPVQDAVLASLSTSQDAGRDLQITSQTGSGKTIALGFALAPTLLGAAAAAARPGPLALVIAPTRELAAQIRDELAWLYEGAPQVTFDCVTGGTNQQFERNRLRQRPTVLVGTPGRLLDHASAGAVDLGGVGQLVLDEADQMLDMGFRDDLEAILATLPEDRRTHLVSATFPPAVRALTQRYQRDPLHIQGTTLGRANADIEHIAHLMNARDRYAALVNHLLRVGDARVLVFVRTREDTTALADQLETDGLRAMSISGDLTQAQRTRTLAAFKRGTVTTLVATDVAARGLDIPDVGSVVHMDLPIDAATYTHRSGRTGRAGQKGASVLFVPRSQERIARRQLSEARVPAQWCPLPTVAEVHAARDERLLAQLGERLAAGPGDARHLALAERLLATNAPAAVIASLLTQLDSGGVSAPIDIGGRAHAAPPSSPRHHAAGSAGATAATAPAAAGRPASHRPPPSARRDDAPAEAGFVTFRINWGVADGADPRRILAHVCRRGGLDSNMVGAIDLGRTSSTFGVVAGEASGFAQRVQRRDRRDPHLVIHPLGPAGAERSAQRGDGPHERAPRRPARVPKIWSRGTRPAGDAAGEGAS
jgi:ATP-dependent RNA helicase DeaD